MREKTNLTRPLKPLNHQLPPLHDLIISPHIKYLPKNFPKQVCSPMQSFFMKKVSPDFVGGDGDYALSSNLFPFLKVHP